MSKLFILRLAGENKGRRDSRVYRRGSFPPSRLMPSVCHVFTSHPHQLHRGVGLRVPLLLGIRSSRRKVQLGIRRRLQLNQIRTEKNKNRLLCQWLIQLIYKTNTKPTENLSSVRAIIEKTEHRRWQFWNKIKTTHKSVSCFWVSEERKKVRLFALSIYEHLCYLL